MDRPLPKTSQTRLGDVTKKTPEGVDAPVNLGVTYLEGGTAVVDAPTSLSVRTAVKLAVVEMILNLHAYDVRPLEIVAGDARPAPLIVLAENSVSMDWPEGSVMDAPLKLTVGDGEEGLRYEDLGLSGPDYLDETINKFGAGTILMHENDVVASVTISANLNTSTARDAVELALQRMFGAEPNDFRTGRRMYLRAYYDQEVRMTLAAVPFSGRSEPTDVQANDYPLSCYLVVETQNVRLVAAPRLFDTMQGPEADMPRE